MVQSSIFRSKVLFANFDQKFFAPRKFGFSPKSSICALSHFWKCESSEIELLAKKKFSLKSSICELWPKNFRSAKVRFCAQKFYLRTLANTFSLRESSVLRPKVLFANFRTFQKCESSEKELLVKFFFVRFKVRKSAQFPPPTTIPQQRRIWKTEKIQKNR